MAEIDYHIVVNEFLDTTDFGIGETSAYIANPTTLAWTEYLNDVGECFFSLAQGDPMIEHLRTDLDTMKHLRIYRNGELVWGGWLGEADETPDDVIIYGYNYASGLYMLHSDWGTEYVDAEVGTIIEALWDRANVDLSKSRMGWMSQGTIQAPVTTSDGAVALELPLYKLYYKRILTAMQELVAYSISDTTNHVIFEITPAGVFNLWKDRVTTTSNVRYTYGEGSVRYYRRLRVPIDRRTVLLGVGSSPISLTLRDTEEATAKMNQYGRLEEAIYFSWVKDATQLDRIVKQRLKRVHRVDSDLLVTFDRNAIVPYRATGAEYALGDDITIDLPAGLSNSGAEVKMVTGQQTLYHRGAENVRLLLADRLT